MSNFADKRLRKQLSEEIVEYTIAQLERSLEIELVWEWVSVADLSVGDIVVTELKRDEVTPKSKATVSKIHVTGDIRHCCNKWRNHRHISFNNGQKGMCYWDEGRVRRMK